MRGEAGRRGRTASWMVLQGPVGPQGPLPLTPISLVLLRRAGHEARGLGLKAILLPPSRADQAPWEQDMVAPRAGWPALPFHTRGPHWPMSQEAV